jgi:hypothetical protein
LTYHSIEGEQLITIHVVADRNQIDTLKPWLFEFWSLLRSEYPEIVKHSRQHLLSFVSTYHCVAAVLKYAFTMNKQRSRLDPEAVIQYQT